MSSQARRPLAWILIVELVFGALIWFGGGPVLAQPAPTPTEAHVEQTTATGTSTTPATVDAKPGDGCPTKKSSSKKKPLSEDLLPIGILIAVIIVVVIRLPKVELGHSVAFRRRRLLNWVPLGLTYTFLYFGRYNIKQFQGIGLTEAEYGTVFGVGSAVYGLAFLLNGPLTDRLGGRATILLSAAGSAVANALMGYMALSGNTFGMTPVTAFAVAFAINMYFQSFGAVSIVKVNAAWFHLRERGTFGGIFGILISLGLYFAYDVGKRITQHMSIEWLFWIPAIILLVFFVLSFLFVRNQPSDTGPPDFDLGDATSSTERLTTKEVFIKLLTHPVILVISFIELCSGFLRQAILQWGVDFGRGVGIGQTFVFENWGMVSCIAGITGGMFAGAVSDHLFNSRRSPVSGFLYGIMVAGAIVLLAMVMTGSPGGVGWIVAFMSMAIIGVHGMLTATASADFAGKANTGTAVGIIDGFVYLGSTAQSFLYGATLPAAKVRDASGCLVPNPEAAIVDNWTVWPLAMLPIAVVGLLLSFKIWNAKPKSGGGGLPTAQPAPAPLPTARTLDEK